MYEERDYEPRHLLEMVLQPAQAWLTPWMTRGTAERIRQYPCRTLLEHGVPLVCIGLIHRHTHAAFAFSFVSIGVGASNGMRVFRFAKRFLDSHPIRRVECTVAVDFEAGHRLMGLLGFTQEAPRLASYEFDGQDVSLYAKVQ